MISSKLIVHDLPLSPASLVHTDSLSFQGLGYRSALGSATKRNRRALSTSQTPRLRVGSSSLRSQIMGANHYKSKDTRVGSACCLCRNPPTRPRSGPPFQAVLQGVGLRPRGWWDTPQTARLSHPTSESQRERACEFNWSVQHSRREYLISLVSGFTLMSDPKH